MDEEAKKELQLLPSQSSYPSSSGPSIAFWPSDPSARQYRTTMMSDHHHHLQQPSLDLKLSISVRPMIHGGGAVPDHRELAGPACEGRHEGAGSVESLKWQAAEQIRLAAIEKAYAERVRELTRREMELAQSEFTRARQMWQRARDEVEKAERMKERATRRMDSSCMEITCQSCRQRFRP